MYSKSGRPNDTGRISFLDYLRAYAFLAVLLWHEFPQPLIHSGEPTFLEVAYNAVVSEVWNGMTGVFVFFLVSGYIITHVILRETAVGFLIKRIFRIYPLFWTAVIAKYLIGDHALPPLPVLLQKLSLFGDFFGTGTTLWGVDWSLRIEILFYAFMLAVRLIVPRGNLPATLPILAILAVLACMFGPRFPTWNPRSVGTLNAYFPLLLLGSCCYLREIYPRHVMALLVGIVLLCSVVTAMPGVIIFMLAWRANGLLYPNGLTTLLADMSYSVYLFHRWFYDFVGWHFKTWPMPAFIAICLACLFATCYLAMILVERPMIKVGARLSKISIGRRTERHAMDNKAQLTGGEVAARG